MSQGICDSQARTYRICGEIAAWSIYMFLLFPSAVLLPISFGNRTHIEFPPREFSLDLYRQFLFDSNWLAVTSQSLKIGVCSAVLAVMVGVPAAYALARGRFRGVALANVAVVSPILIPVIVIALGLHLYFSSLRILGTATALIAAHTVLVMPFVVITVGSAIRQLDPNLEIAASVMGSGPFRTLWKVTLPQVVPALVASFLFAFLISFDEVVIAWFVTGVSSYTLPVKMYSSIQFEISPVIAAVSMVLTALSLTVCLVTALVLRPRTLAGSP